MQTAQRLAAKTLTRVLSGTTLPAALAQILADHDRERALVHELCYGSLRYLGQLRSLVRQLVAKPLSDPAVEALLWVALYQLIHTGAPGHAVVDQAVRASFATRRGSARGLVNGVLRSFLRGRRNLLAQAAADDEGRYSYPPWWIERVRDAYPDHWQAILDGGNARPPLCLRVNRRAGSRESYRSMLSAAGIAADAVGLDGIILREAQDVRTLPGYGEGRFSVQDYGAQLAGPLLGAADGMRVLDACAAPGGKTTHVLELRDVDMLALDRDPQRMSRLRENLGRLRLRAATAVGDAAEPQSWWDGKPFDRILADVPCTASGVVRRHPDGKWLRRESDLSSFARQQDGVLDALWPCLAPGGRMLYATCSIFPEENAQRVLRFVARTKDATHEMPPLPAGVQSELGHDAIGAQLLPCGGGAEHNHDGFFYALLLRSR